MNLFPVALLVYHDISLKSYVGVLFNPVAICYVFYVPLEIIGSSKCSLSLSKYTIIETFIKLPLVVFIYVVSLIIFKMYSKSGVSAISVINIADVVSQVVFILASGMGTSTSIMVGYKLGSNQLEEAEENANYLLGYAVFMGVIIMAIISVLAFIVPHFYNIQDSTKRLTTYAILIQGAVAPIMMMTRIPFFVLRSGGRVLEILLLDSIFMWVVKVPIALLFGNVFDVNIIILFLAVESTRLLNAFVSLFFYRQKLWLKNLSVDV